MNKLYDSEKDPLLKYLDPERIEKAPENFTGRIMSKITAEIAIAGNTDRLTTKSRVPLISVIVTLVLIASAFLLRNVESVYSFHWELSDYIPDISVSRFVDKITYAFNSGIPEWFPWLIVSLAFLVLVDRALDTYSQSRKNI